MVDAWVEDEPKTTVNTQTGGRRDARTVDNHLSSHRSDDVNENTRKKLRHGGIDDVSHAYASTYAVNSKDDACAHEAACVDDSKKHMHWRQKLAIAYRWARFSLSAPRKFVPSAKEKKEGGHADGGVNICPSDPPKDPRIADITRRVSEYTNKKGTLGQDQAGNGLEEGQADVCRDDSGRVGHLWESQLTVENEEIQLVAAAHDAALTGKLIYIYIYIYIYICC
jgi:hypothetical protein